MLSVFPSDTIRGWLVYREGVLVRSHARIYWFQITKGLECQAIESEFYFAK